MRTSKRPTGPLGKGDIVVEPGESVESIAFELGYFYQTIWDHPDNAELRAAREDHNTLLPGDRLTLPPKTTKTVTVATNQRHVFRRKGVPATVRVRVLNDAGPRKNEKYRLEVDGVVYTGTTSDEGVVEQRISPGAVEGVLYVGEDEARHDLDFGMLDPGTETDGIAQRLTNLGYECGPLADDELGLRMRGALAAFQRARGLPETGEIDDATRGELLRVHDEGR